jgi:hypothetical protein
MTLSFFTSSSYLYHCHLLCYFNFENFEHGLPQLEHPKGVEVHNVTSCPKVAKATNDIHHSKAAKSNNTIVSVFCPFFSFQIFDYQSYKTQ